MKGPGGPRFKIDDAYSFASQHGFDAEIREIRSMRVHPESKEARAPERRSSSYLRTKD